MPITAGYLIGTTLFLAVFVVAVIAQISTRRFNAWIYWLAIVASTTVGTAMADFFDRSLGVGYTGGSSILLACVLASLAAWYFTLGSIDVQTVATPKVEIFYWVTITFSQTLGTALGDWTADSTGLGYDGGALVFGVGLLVLAALYFWTTVSRVFLFWAAFILTRPLGATVGDFLDKPTSHGGLALSRPLASFVIIAVIVFPSPTTAGRPAPCVARRDRANLKAGAQLQDCQPLSLPSDGESRVLGVLRWSDSGREPRGLKTQFSVLERVTNDWGSKISKSEKVDRACPGSTSLGSNRSSRRRKLKMQSWSILMKRLRS